MLSKTHLSCGIAAALAVLQPHDAKGLAAAVVGGALGGSIPDIDIVKNRTGLDSVVTQTAACMIAAGAVFCDYYYQFGILHYLRMHPESAATGCFLYIVLVIAGFYSPHRSFTHSIAAMFLFTSAAGILYPGIAAAYMLGYVSHLSLDLLNRKPERLLFPLKKGFCLKLCYSNRTVNHLFFVLGCVVTAGFLLSGLV